MLRKIANFVECRFNEAPNETALDVTKPLVQFALRLPPFVRRTNSLSATTKAVRDALTSASDPFTLLFDALPTALGLGVTQTNLNPKPQSDDLVARLGAAVAELANAEAKTIASLKKSIFGALQAGTGDRDDFEELRSRARLIPTDTGDERLNGLISRARNADDSDEWVKAVASLGAGKPYRSWTDADVAAAKMQLIDLGRRFQHVESFVLSTRKRGKTVSFALTVQDNKSGVPQTISSSLTLNKKSQAAVDNSLAELRRVFSSLDLDTELKKAAAVSMLIELEEEQARADQPERAIA